MNDISSSFGESIHYHLGMVGNSIEGQTRAKLERKNPPSSPMDSNLYMDKQLRLWPTEIEATKGIDKSADDS